MQVFDADSLKGGKEVHMKTKEFFPYPGSKDSVPGDGSKANVVINGKVSTIHVQERPLGDDIFKSAFTY